MDGVLAQATSRWNAMRLRAQQDQARDTLKVNKQSELARQGRRMPEPPPGWGSPADAAKSSMLAAKMLKRKG